MIDRRPRLTDNEYCQINFTEDISRYRMCFIQLHFNQIDAF